MALIIQIGVDLSKMLRADELLKYQERALTEEKSIEDLIADDMRHGLSREFRRKKRKEATK